MIWPFNKKQKVTFICTAPGVESIMPIIPAKEYKHAWIVRAQQDFAKCRKEKNFGTSPENHTVKCPGIVTLQKQGWILRTWQDICIETYGDGHKFTWNSAVDQTKLDPLTGSYVGHHASEQYATYMENWDPNTLKTVIKIQSPWLCLIPKGHYLLEIPVPYLDDNRFIAVPGMFDCDLGYAPLNVQLLWRVKEGKAVIKAGTPIAQYILVPKEKIDFEIKTHGKSDMLLFGKLLNQFRFVRNYSEIKRLVSRGGGK